MQTISNFCFLNLIQLKEGVKRIRKDTGDSAIMSKRKSHKETTITHSGYPVSCLEYAIEMNKKRLHPTQKPVALLEYLIKTYTLENETVLDFTMGSGSTGVACKNLNRKFIGIEKDDKYFEIANSRLGKKPLNGK